MYLSRLLSKFTDLIFSNFCYYCQKSIAYGEQLCILCLQNIKPVVSKDLKIGTNKIVKVHALGKYEEPLKSLILSKSSSDISACKTIAELLWQHSILKQLDFDIIIPIPLHWQRYSARGYNQSEEIAKFISQFSQKPYQNLLKRIKHTPFLSSIDLSERHNQLKSALIMTKPELVFNKKILLVDDAITSGATIESAAKELFKASPAQIEAIVLARTC